MQSFHFCVLTDLQEQSSEIRGTATSLVITRIPKIMAKAFQKVTDWREEMIHVITFKPAALFYIVSVQ